MSARSSSRSLSARSVLRERVSDMIHGMTASAAAMSMMMPASMMVLRGCGASGCRRIATQYAATRMARPRMVVGHWLPCSLNRSHAMSTPLTVIMAGRIMVVSPVRSMMMLMMSMMMPAKAMMAGLGARRMASIRLSLDGPISGLSALAAPGV